MKYIALFGPPASGKSTLIKEFKKLGIKAYDIERCGDSYNERKINFNKILKKEKSNYIIFGTADMKITDFPKNTIKILLLPPINIYKSRLKERNRKYPHKKDQNAIKKYLSIDKNKYDLVLDKDYSKADIINKIKTISKNKIKIKFLSKLKKIIKSLLIYFTIGLIFFLMFLALKIFGVTNYINTDFVVKYLFLYLIISGFSTLIIFTTIFKIYAKIKNLHQIESKNLLSNIKKYIYFTVFIIIFTPVAFIIANRYDPNDMPFYINMFSPVVYGFIYELLKMKMSDFIKKQQREN